MSSFHILLFVYLAHIMLSPLLLFLGIYGLYSSEMVDLGFNVFWKSLEPLSKLYGREGCSVVHLN